MAILQVRDIDDNLYENLKNLAKKEHRSISQEVIHIIEYYISRPSLDKASSTEEFLNLSFSGKDTADVMINQIKSGRKKSDRF